MVAPIIFDFTNRTGESNVLVVQRTLKNHLKNDILSYIRIFIKPVFIFSFLFLQNFRVAIFRGINGAYKNSYRCRICVNERRFYYERKTSA